jgi:hypothetical protein
MYGSSGSSTYQTQINTLQAAQAVGTTLIAVTGVGPVRALFNVMIVAPLKNKVYDYLGSKMNPQSPDVVHDKYSESILAEVMSSQQTESKRESAPRFIRPKKKKDLRYRA